MDEKFGSNSIIPRLNDIIGLIDEREELQKILAYKTENKRVEGEGSHVQNVMKASQAIASLGLLDLRRTDEKRER